MRVNEPITGQEIELPDGAILVSRTDLGGRITFVNQAFIDVSGYGEEDLIGAPHNLVRHPHMPPAAFADLWTTIKAGKPWEGIVKNRARNGDHYWVRANVTPEVSNGEVTGYISIRSPATRSQIEAAERIYGQIRADQARHIKIEEGRIVSTTLAARLSRSAHSVAGRLAGMVALQVGAMGLNTWMTLSGNGDSAAVPVTLFCVSTAVVAVLATLLVRYIQKPLTRQEKHFDAIARGDFTHEIGIEEVREFQRSNAMLRAMEAKLGYSALAQKETTERAQQQLKRDMLSLTELLEGEVDTTVAEISTQAERLKEGAAQMLDTASELRTIAQSVSSAIQITNGNVQTVAGATQQLEASSHEISSRVQRSSDLSQSARKKVDVACASVSTLTEATARIGDVVGLIKAIAGQTRMLSLNATIEAARAGEMGKGFAVVANEVKGLAEQTEQAIGRVHAQANEIDRTTRESVATVETVAEAIHDMDVIASQVAAAADEQRAATGEIMASATQAADHTREVASTTESVLKGADLTGVTARKVSELAAMVSHDIGALQRRLNVILRTSYSGNRRAVERIPAGLEFSAKFAGQTFRGQTGDVSTMGALLVVGNAPKLEGESGTVEFPGIGALAAKAILGSALGIQCQFTKISAQQRRDLAAAIEQAKARDIPFIETAQRIATQIGQVFDQAVAGNQISLADLFDSTYSPIEGTDPQQLMAAHTDFADRVLPSIIEPPLTAQPRVVLCCATDRNGYIATHNKKCSQPQRPGDTVWNTAHSRNRRIFDDRTGILAARSIKPYLAQTYARDMGGGQFMLLKEFDAPIMVGKRHWGALRFAVEL